MRKVLVLAAVLAALAIPAFAAAPKLPEGYPSKFELAADNASLFVQYSDGSIARFDTATGALVSVFKTKETMITAIKLSPDGTQLAIGTDYGSLQVWDPVTGKRTFKTSLSAYSSKVTSLVFSADGKFLAAASIGVNALTVWRTADFVQITGYPDMSPTEKAQVDAAHDFRLLTLPYRNIDFTSEGNIVAIREFTAYVREISPVTGLVAETKLPGYNLAYQRAKQLVYAFGYVDSKKTWEFQTFTLAGLQAKSQPVSLGIPAGAETDAYAISPDGKYGALHQSKPEYKLHLYALDTFAALPAPAIEQNEADRLVFSADSTLLVWKSSKRKTAVIWDIKAGAIKTEIKIDE